jgi:hypothetical protein
MDGSRQEKSIGYSPSTSTGNAGENPQARSLESVRESQASNTAPSKEESVNSTGGVLASVLMALLIMAGDFQNLKKELPHSWKAASNDGKIYWCASLSDHKLAFDPDGNLLVDGEKASDLLANLLAGVEKSSGGDTA